MRASLASSQLLLMARLPHVPFLFGSTAHWICSCSLLLAEALLVVCEIDTLLGSGPGASAFDRGEVIVDRRARDQLGQGRGTHWPTRIPRNLAVAIIYHVLLILSITLDLCG